MKPITKDVLVTLSIKLLLLFCLWFLCFKPYKHHHVDMKQWLMGAQINGTAS